MPSTTATVGALLHEDIAPGIANQLNNETPLLDSFTDVKNARVVGRNRVRGVRVNRNRGGYYTAEGGTPPTAQTVQIEEMRVPLKYYHHAMSFTKQVLDASETDRGAFEDVMRLGSEDIVDGIKIQRNQALWGDGKGVRCLINGAASSTTQTVDSPGGIAGADDGTRFLNVGDYICFVNPAGSLRLTTVHQITQILSGTQFVITPTASTTDNDYVVKCAYTSGTLTIDMTEYMHPPMGLNGMVDAGAWVNILHGISRTTFPVMSSTVIGTSAAPAGAISADLIQRAIDSARKVSGKNTDEIWMESAAKRAYLTLMEKDRRYTATDLQTPNAGTTASGGSRAADTGLRFGKIPIMEDFACPYGFLCGLNKAGALRFPGPEGFLNDDGSTLHMSTTAIDQWDAYYRHFENFTHEQPNACWKVVGATVDVVVAHTY